MTQKRRIITILTVLVALVVVVGLLIVTIHSGRGGVVGPAVSVSPVTTEAPASPQSDDDSGDTPSSETSVAPKQLTDAPDAESSDTPTSTDDDATPDEGGDNS